MVDLFEEEDGYFPGKHEAFIAKIEWPCTSARDPTPFTCVSTKNKLLNISIQTTIKVFQYCGGASTSGPPRTAYVYATYRKGKFIIRRKAPRQEW